MDRLTIPDVPIDGGMRRAIIDARAVRQQAMTIYWKLKEYEDLEERLQSVYGECDGLLKKVVELLERHEGVDLLEPVLKAKLLTDGAVDRWEEYKKLEEQRKLLKLPCVVGDTVYRINRGAEEPIMPMTVLEIAILSLNIEGYVLQIMCRDNTDCGETYYFSDDLGKIVFFTREEAQAALYS